MYQPRITAEQHVSRVGGLNYRVNTWGDPAADPLFFLHGWADVGMSFQFLADELAGTWYCIAPDWRGFGESEWQQGGYWYPQYLADLDELLDQYSPDRKARLAGHSMGGNIAWVYAGIRPDRVSHAISLDAFGLMDSDPDEAPMHYARWLDQLKQTPCFSSYASIDDVAERIKKLAGRLGKDQAEYLAAYWARPETSGGFRIRHDPTHKRVNPVMYRRQEVKSCWRMITAKTLLVLARESVFLQRYEKDGHRQELQRCLPDMQEVIIEESGHMLHLEQPSQLARILGSFLRL